MEEQKSLKTITPISEDNMQKIRNMSAATLPDRPSQQGMKPEQIKKRFYEPIVNSDISVIEEVNRIVGEANDMGNELSTRIDTENTTNSAQNAAIEALQGDLGDINGLSEDFEAGSLVDAINGFLATYKKKVGTRKDVKELDVLIATLQGLYNALSDFINEDAETLKTNSQHVVAAINELLEIINEIKKDYATTSAVSEGYVSMSGDSVVDGTLSVKNLIVEGDSEIADTQHLWVKDAVIVANSDGVQLAGVHGYIIRVDADVAYGIVYEPKTNTLKIGKGEYSVESYPDANLETKTRVVFTFDDEQGQAIATRGYIENGNIPKWNGEKFTFEDSKKAADKLVAVTQEIADGNLAKWNADGHTFVDAGKPADKVALQDGAMVHGALPVWDIGKRAWVNSGKTPEMLQAVGSANVVANALKGRASGEVIRLDDVSTLSHMFDVELQAVDILKLEVIGGDNEITYNNDSVTVTSEDNKIWGIKFNPFDIGLIMDRTYKFSVDTDATDADLRWRCKKKDSQKSEYIISDNGEIKITLTSEIENLFIYVGFSYAASSVTFREMKVTDMSVGKTYIFYHPNAIELYASGKNLIKEVNNMSDIQSFVVSEDGSAFTISSANGSNQLYGLLISVGSDVLKVDETYTFSIHCPKHADRWGWRVEYEDGTIATDLNGVTINLNQSETVSLTVQQQISKISFYAGQPYSCQEGESITLSEPQIEFGKDVTEFAPFAEMQTYTFNDSFKTSIPSIAPEALLFANDKGIVIDVKYNRDVNKAFAQLEARLSALEKGGKEQ